MPDEKLYNALNKAGYYTKSYEDFQAQFSTPEAQKKLHGALNSSGFYTKPADEFQSQFFGESVSKEDSESLTEPSALVSTPEQEFLTQKEEQSRIADIEKGYNIFQKYTLQPVQEDISFEKSTEGFEETYEKEKTAENVEAHRSAMLPYLADVSDIKNRLEEIPNYFPEHAQQAKELAVLLEEGGRKEYKAVKEGLQAIETKVYRPMSVMAAYGGMTAGGDPNWLSYEHKVINNPNNVAINKLIEDTKKLKEISKLQKIGDIEGVVDKVGVAAKGIAKGMAKGIGDYVMGYTNLLADLKASKAIVDIVKKTESEERLTKDEQLLMRVIMDNTEAHSELDKEIPTSYKMGEAVGFSMGFTLEFLATGGTSTYKSIVKAGIKGGAKVATKIAVKSAAKLAEAGRQTAMMPSFYKGVAENVANGMGFGDAVLYSYWTTGAEVVSEMIFMNMGGKGARSFLQKAGINFEADKGAVGVFKNTLEEGLEEKIGEIMTAPKDYDGFAEFWKGFTDKEQNIIMIGSVGIMTGGMGSVALSGNSLSKTMRGMKLKRIEKNVPSDLRAEIDVILENKDLSLNQQSDLIISSINDRIEKSELGDDVAKTVSNAIAYYSYKVQEKSEESTDENAVVKDGEMTVGKVEEVGDMQEQLDYLIEKGVDANGLNGEQVEKLYVKTKTEEDRDAIAKAEGEAIPEIPAAYEDAMRKYKMTSLGDKSETNKNKLIEQAQTAEGKEYIQKMIDRAIKTGNVKLNEDGTITVYRVGSVREGNKAPVTLDKEFAEKVMAKERKQQGLSDKVHTLTINPNDIVVVVPGIESELIVNITQNNVEETAQEKEAEQPEVFIKGNIETEKEKNVPETEAVEVENQPIDISKVAENLQKEKLLEKEKETSSQKDEDKLKKKEVKDEFVDDKKMQEFKSEKEMREGEQAKQRAKKEGEAETVSVKEAVTEKEKKLGELKKQVDEVSERLQIKETAAKDKIAEGLSDLATALGAKKELIGEERKSAEKAVRKIAEGLVEHAGVKLSQLREVLAQYLKGMNFNVPQDLLDKVMREYKESRRTVSVKEHKLIIKEIGKEVTGKVSKIKEEALLEETQSRIDEARTLIDKQIATIDKQGIVVSYKKRGSSEKRYEVKRDDKGVHEVRSLHTKRKTLVAERKLKRAIIDKYSRQRKKDIEEIMRREYYPEEERILDELDERIISEVEAYKAEREKDIPEKKAVPEKVMEPVQKTEVSEGKKRREKRPSQKEATRLVVDKKGVEKPEVIPAKITVDEAVSLKNQIRMEAKAAREAKRYTDKEFREVSRSIVSKLKVASDSDFITKGQYRSIIRRIGSATTEKSRKKLYDYVDKILFGSEYKGKLAEARKYLLGVKKQNRGDKSKFGDAKKMADELTSIDVSQLTIDELSFFNKQVKKILINKKAPSISYMEILVGKYKDKTKQDYDRFSEKIAKAKEEGTIDKISSELKNGLNKYIDETDGFFKNIETPQDFIKAFRRISVTRKKINRLLDEGIITGEEAKVLFERTSGDEKVSGEWNEKLSDFKDDYVKILTETAKEASIKTELLKLTTQEQEAYRELLSANAKSLNELSISELEAYEISLENLRDGYTIPEAYQIRRKLNSIYKRHSATDKATTIILGSKRWASLIKRGFTNKTSFVLQKVKGAKIEGVNLRELIGSTKKHWIDQVLGNFSKFNTIHSIYYSGTKALQKAANKSNDFQEIRLKAYRKLKKKFGRKTSDAVKDLGNFLIERSWQQEDFYLKGNVDKTNASYLNAVFFGKGLKRKGILRLSEFYKERDRYLRMISDAKDKGLTKNIDGIEILDINKYEQHLRKTKEVSDFIDFHDKYYKSTAPFDKVSTMENGRTFIEKEEYTPFRGKESGAKIDPKDIKADIESGFINPKMQANSTHNRKGAIRWLENDVFKTMEDHTNEILRNYYVYPEVISSLEALKKSFDVAMESKEYNTLENATLRDALMTDFKDVVARYYNSGRYSIKNDKAFDTWTKGAKKGMLANPARILPEFLSNTIRSINVVTELYKEKILMTKEEKIAYGSLFEQYISDKYWSQYSPEIGGVSRAKGFRGSLEKGADWIITFSDKAIGKPLMRSQFDEAFKQITNKEFNPKEYLNNPDYYISNREAIDKAAAWGIKRVEELFNDKTILTTPQLTTFIAGIVKAEAGKKSTRLFDTLQSFNRNEVIQLIHSSERIASGDPELIRIGTRDIAAVVTSNMAYQVLRRASGIGMSVALAGLLGQTLADYEEEKMSKLLSGEELKRDIRRTFEGFAMGGSANVYGWFARIGMFVMEKTDILSEDQKNYVYKIMMEDLYGTKIPEFGSVSKILVAVSPIPAPAITDMIKTFDGLAAFVSALHQGVSEGRISKEQQWQLVGLTNLMFKYFAPNAVSPTAQRLIDRKIRKSEMRGKKKPSGYADFGEAEIEMTKPVIPDFSKPDFIKPVIPDFITPEF